MQTTLTHTELKRFVSTDEYRPALQGVYLDADNECIVATNGHIMAVVPVVLNEGDESAVIPVDAFDHRPLDLKKSELDTFRRIEVRENEVTVRDTSSRRIVFSTIDETFPNYRAVIPEIPSAPVVEHIGLDLGYANAIHRAVKVLTEIDDSCVLHFTSKNRAVVIQPNESFPDGKKPLFLWMPTSTNELNKPDYPCGDSMPAEAEMAVSS